MALRNTCRGFCMVALVICITICQPPTFAQAAPLCSEVLVDTRVIGVAEYHNLSKWLFANRNSIVPSETHLQALEPLLLQIREDLRRALIDKVKDPYYAQRAPQMRSFLREMQDRISSKTLTYEYLYFLPYRLGIFTNTRVADPLREQFYDRVEFPEVLDSKNYRTHAGTMKVIKKYSGVKMNPKFRASTWTGVYEDFLKFPKSVYLPYSGSLGLRDINLLYARKVRPIGISFRLMEVDGDKFDELLFALHDRGHGAQQDQSYFENTQIPNEIMSQMSRAVLVQVERQRRASALQWDLLHFLHFQMYHENAGVNWSFRDDKGEFTEVRSWQNIRNYLHFGNAEIMQKAITEDFPGYASTRQEFQSIMSKYPNADAQAELQKAIDTYESFQQAELNKLDTDRPL